MSRVLVPLAAGFEEIEAITVVDLLRRAGIEVHTASLAERAVTDEFKGVVDSTDAPSEEEP